MEDAEEIPLSGGTLSTVVRVGDTVRRSVGPWTATVHSLLDHLERRGFDLSPRALGYDAQGREILSFLPGDTAGWTTPWPEWVRDEGLLAQIGETTATYHRAVAGFRPSGPVPWHSGPAEIEPGQIVCHNDLAPYNVVVAAGRLTGIMDWDLIGPGTYRSELAFIAWQWVPLHDPLVTSFFGWSDPPDRAHRLRILLDAYGLDERDGFVEDVISRIHFNRRVMITKASEGDPAYTRLVEAGHVMGMERALAFLESEGPVLQSQLG